MMVLLCHYVELYCPNQSLVNITYLGPLGVNIFFVISGFLITTLCLKEKINTGSIALRNFYTRRALRIIPVAYLYLTTIIILNAIFNFNILPLTFGYAFLFLSNLSISRRSQFSWNIAHYWSLATEEQFYLIFPFLLKKAWYLYIITLITIIFLVPLAYYLQTQNHFLNYPLAMALIKYLLKFQGIAIGCFFAIMLFKGFINFGKKRSYITLLSIIVVLGFKYSSDLNYRAVFINCIISIFTGFIVTNSLHPDKNAFFKFLNLKILNTIGILSYSIYIWQQLFLSNDPKFLPSRVPLNIFFLVVVPCLSFYFYERYFLKIKSRLRTNK